MRVMLLSNARTGDFSIDPLRVDHQACEMSVSVLFPPQALAPHHPYQTAHTRSSDASGRPWSSETTSEAHGRLISGPRAGCRSAINDRESGVLPRASAATTLPHPPSANSHRTPDALHTYARASSLPAYPVLHKPKYPALRPRPPPTMSIPTAHRKRPSFNPSFFIRILIYSRDEYLPCTRPRSLVHRPSSTALQAPASAHFKLTRHRYRAG